MYQLLVTEITDLQAMISEAVKQAIGNIPQQPPTPTPDPDSEELISRKQAAKIFQVSLVTLNDWTKKGLIPFYRMNRRVFFRRSEVLNSMKRIHGKLL